MTVEKRNQRWAYISFRFPAEGAVDWVETYIGLEKTFNYNHEGRVLGWKVLQCNQPPFDGGVVYCGPSYYASKVYIEVPGSRDPAKTNWLSEEERDMGGPVPSLGS